MSDGAKRFVAAYAGAAAGQPYEIWREELCRGFCRMDVEPSRHDRIDCRTVYTTISSVTLARPTGLSGRFMRTREILSDGRDDLLLFSAVRGPVQVTQGHKTIDLSQGQMCLAEMNETCAVALRDGNEFTTARIPRTSLLQLAPHAEDKLCQPLADASALRAMVDEYTRLCIDVAPGLDAIGQQRAAQHLIDLTGLLLGAAADHAELAAQRGYSHSRFELIKSDVLKNLHRHDLTIDLVARARGLSPRQAQRFFACSGTTFTEFVLTQRLSLAHRLLNEPRFRNRKITDVAYTAGFGDLSYFNREFRRRFGDTPSAIRNGNITDSTNALASM